MLEVEAWGHPITGQKILLMLAILLLLCLLFEDPAPLGREVGNLKAANGLPFGVADPDDTTGGEGVAADEPNILEAEDKCR